ncbi:MAG TPA: choice-of-anchor tandem repeat GloVer-containing protein [Rhizomicrobium sp.]|jgi:uncharacterized repeat protein (TIGR03803 family)|nr:choice-of-anchor tandem repeat GloVer-containing protein [Rhizomicrobium sp.]
MNSRFTASALLGLLAACSISVPCALSATEKVIYSFRSGSYPYGRLEQDPSGALYGTAYNQKGSGTAYQLTEKQGVWTFLALHTFGGSGDGAHPYAGPLVDLAQGIFYGVTQYGGTQNRGTVYSVVPSGKNSTEKVLYSFSGGQDGAHPTALLARDKTSGALYGTAVDSGRGCGSAFTLTPNGDNWTFSSLYDFVGGSGDGCNPSAQLKPGAKAGTWFGATEFGGANGVGTVFSLAEKGGVWSESLVYTFSGDEGGNPLDLDSSDDGTIYGVAYAGGQQGAGTVFQLTPRRKKFDYSVIYPLAASNAGVGPLGVKFDSKAGRLLVIAGSGGAYGGGALLSLTPGSPYWNVSVLHSFGSGLDGRTPESRVEIDQTTGDIYGTTISGGAHGGGAVYQVTP